MSTITIFDRDIQKRIYEDLKKRLLIENIFYLYAPISAPYPFATYEMRSYKGAEVGGFYTIMLYIYNSENIKTIEIYEILYYKNLENCMDIVKIVKTK